MPILLVPHVGVACPPTEDFELLWLVRQTLAQEVKVPIDIVSQDLNAAELKWAIGRCAVFAGARTHSTIAAISSCVPTLSIGYSLKADGINYDVYGHRNYCIHVSDLSPDNFAHGLRLLLENENAIRAQLQVRVPELQAQAYKAGAMLRAIASKYS
jgi:polysaccharide pyruvyl transferase WcaK-like protein